MISWFYALSSILTWKARMTAEANITRQAFYFSEKFFDMIKSWWWVDYEEYFNRKVMNLWNSWDEYLSGYYKHKTGFGNFWNSWIIWSDTYWDNFYFCISWDWNNMWTWWCIDNYNANLNWDTSIDNNWEAQRYGQYAIHFIDFNVNADDDNEWTYNILWDEDDDWSFIWDEDDEYLWVWPLAFDNNKVQELYLISSDLKTRTFFRWKVIQDPNTSQACDFTTNPDNPTWEWCYGNIQFLKLNWVDYWLDHKLSWTWSYDWVIDTWIYEKDMYWDDLTWTWVVAWSLDDDSSEARWVNIFPSDINVKDVKFYLYPSTDIKLAWKDDSDRANIAPYVRLHMIISPSIKSKRVLKWINPEVKIATSISLTDIWEMVSVDSFLSNINNISSQ